MNISGGSEIAWINVECNGDSVSVAAPSKVEKCYSSVTNSFIGGNWRDSERIGTAALPKNLCVHCTILYYAEPFDATLHRLCTVLQMSAKLVAIELVHFTISCSNSTWATGPFIIWLDYSCLGCSVSWRKTKPSIIWPCHSFISYAILQPILRPALYLLIYWTSLYFWWWSPPIPVHWI